MADLNLETWRKTFRASMDLLSTLSLTALQAALRDNSPKLIQGATTQPPPLQACASWPVEAACLYGYCGWAELSDGTMGELSVEEVETFFGNFAWELDKLTGEQGAIRWAANHFDESPRAEVFAQFLAEVDREINRRALEEAHA